MDETIADIFADVPVACGYWAEVVLFNNDGDGFYDVRDREGEMRPARFRPADIAAWLKSEKVAAFLPEVGDPYQRHALMALHLGQWLDADWDTDTVDLIVQGMLLHGIVYG